MDNQQQNQAETDTAKTRADEPQIGAFVTDLILGSKITAAGMEAGKAVRMCRSRAAVEGFDGRMLLVDLTRPDARDVAVQWKTRTGGRAIGFVPHVDQEAINLARDAGLEVMTRGSFVSVLSSLLSG